MSEKLQTSLQKLKQLVGVIEYDLENLLNGKKVASTRVRAKLLDIIKECKTMRSDAQEYKNSLPKKKVPVAEIPVAEKAIETPVAEIETPVEPAKKKRGRPKKNKQQEM